MTVPIKQSSTYKTEIETEITTRDSSIETQYGPVRDVVITPAATVFEEQNTDIRAVENLQTLVDPESIDDTDLDNMSFNNEQIKRNDGSKSTGAVVFRTSVLPLANLTVPQGFPVATIRDDITGTQIQFVTAAAATLVAASAALYFNPATGYYELSVPIEAVNSGAASTVSANRITVLQRPISGFTSVTNLSGTSQSTDQETNMSVVERIQISRQGTDISTPLGVVAYVRENFDDVVDIIIVYGNDPLLTRQTDAGAVDAYIKGQVLASKTESYEYSGADHIFLNQPVANIVSATNGVDVYIQGVDFELAKDTGIYGGSVRAVDVIRFIPGAILMPAIGDIVAVQYQINQLVVDLQADIDQEVNAVFGRDLLFKDGVVIAIQITANLHTLTGFTPATVQGAVRTAIKNFVNALKLGDDVEMFDVNAAVVTGVRGVDNLVFTLFDVVGGAGVAADIPVDKNEYAVITDVYLTVNLV